MAKVFSLRLAAGATGLALVACVIACAPIMGFAGDVTPSALSLEQAQAQALRRNADFRVASIQVEAALGQLKAAREYANPTLSLLTSKISTDGAPEGTPLGNGLLDRAYDSVASLSQLILVGKRGLQRDAATAGVHAAEYQRDDARRLLVQSVTQAYAGALAADEQARVLTDSAAKLRREATIAEYRFKAGDLSAGDRSQLEIAADQDELGAAAQIAAARAAVVALETLLGETHPEGSTRLTDTLAILMMVATPELQDAAVAQRPDIAAAEESVHQAEANYRLQQRQRVPDVTLSVQYERNPPAQPDTVGVGVSLPLPLWNHFQGEVASARAARDQAEVQLDKIRIQAWAQVSSARLAYREASERERRYRLSLVPKSAEVTRSLAYAFEKGGASFLDLLQAERNDNAIRVAAVQAQADTASAAVALAAALGRSVPPSTSEARSP